VSKQHTMNLYKSVEVLSLKASG